MNELPVWVWYNAFCVGTQYIKTMYVNMAQLEETDSEKIVLQNIVLQVSPVGSIKLCIYICVTRNF